MTAVLPSTREEDWRWADLSTAAALGDAPPPPGAGAAPAFAWVPVEARRLLFVGGQPMEGDARPVPALAGAPAHPLADRAIGAAGTLIDLPAGIDGAIVELGWLGTGGAARGHTRVRLGPGARLVVIESFADEGRTHWANHRFDAEIAPGAELVRLVRVANDAGLVTDRAFATVAAGGRFRQLLLATGAGASRSDAEVWLDGEGAHAAVDGIMLGGGTAAHDGLTRLRHRAPGATSAQKWRLVAAGRARVSVSGGIMVERDAQKTGAEQSLKALLFGRAAAANMKPELRIHADDVRCAHGCTVGALDRPALFYLAARGIPPAAAQALLTEAFVADAAAGLADTPLAPFIADACGRWLAGMETGA